LGHGRNLYEQTLRIPMSITWPERLAPRAIAAPALLIDLTPTVIGLLDAERPAALAGFDWSAVFAGAPEPLDRETRYQAHRGAVLSQHESDLARRSGLLAVGILRRDVKEVFYEGRGKREMFDLAADPAESRDLSGAGDRSASEAVLSWMTEVENGLSRVDAMPPAEPLDEDTASMLRSLGYVD
jgi:arylsulfatase A-like enzyme